MTIDQYVEKLRGEQNSSESCCTLSREGEIQYMEAAKDRFARIFGMIPGGRRPIRILDVGPTPFTLFIKEALPEHEVWGLDRTDLLKDRFEQRGVRFKSCNLDEGKIPFGDEFFDVIIFTEVLEHVFGPPSELLQELRRVLRPGGELILGVPNIARLANRLRLVFGVSPLPDPDNQMKRDWVHGHGHIHEYTRGEIVGLCKKNGMEVRQTWMFSPRPGGAAMGRR
ncbi:MAG: class I SAM-dependent methyltransferase, partial [Thermoguttaceae bacterium]